MKTQPFALMVYRRYLDGETVEELAAGLGIPAERIEQRIRVGALLQERLNASGKVTPLPLEAD
ncbi:MAG TPA: sigma factor-like helix-turn-helix DNA-binding protein [Bryobacteraceae bacterium]|nr:sigma factor-like helix-turn-helix DNA-binding protein [Bryobacteraceae bacterium]HOL73660.1 sigma factor-like helix-turn-helix DNA-binding protein [Bryobacteraceae bacterium]HOQ46135.1 sigma factor-like helix-turn-helix DNA-binding protein [Bryobacteraceae bacterium]HPQ14714.1 sigma factor-like helix-turn-helix DNA-binding protein [Bryobacteraceae bacterium]HPU72724.1 sigma factor-like helix-turn-helix DNA-binding protein [Bryobacteraceae bacterium]